MKKEDVIKEVNKGYKNMFVSATPLRKKNKTYNVTEVKDLDKVTLYVSSTRFIALDKEEDKLFSLRTSNTIITMSDTASRKMHNYYLVKKDTYDSIS